MTGSNGKIIWIYDKYNRTIVNEVKYRGYRPDVDYGQSIKICMSSISILMVSVF